MIDSTCRGGEDGNHNVSAKTSGKWVPVLFSKLANCKEWHIKATPKSLLNYFQNRMHFSLFKEQ